MKKKKFDRKYFFDWVYDSTKIFLCFYIWVAATLYTFESGLLLAADMMFFVGVVFAVLYVLKIFGVTGGKK